MNIEIIILSMVEEYKWSNGYKVKEGEKVFSIESTNFFFISKTTYPKNYQRLLNSNRVKEWEYFCFFFKNLYLSNPNRKE